MYLSCLASQAVTEYITNMKVELYIIAYNNHFISEGDLITVY